MKKIDEKWLVRICVLIIILIAVTTFLISINNLAKIVAGLLIVAIIVSWVIAWRGSKETIHTLPKIIGLALAWSAGAFILFVLADTPPSTLPSEPSSFVPNGTGRIAFTEGWEIYVMNADGTGKTLLISKKYEPSFPVWSPDGEQMAFVSRDEIYIMNDDATNSTRLTNTVAASNWAPLWSPDGQRIAFLSDRGGGGIWDAYVMNADGTNQIRLTYNYQNNRCTPAWSPDGQHLGFVSKHSTGSPELYVIKVDGSDPIHLTRDTYKLKWTWRVGWSPDGEQMAFVGKDGIYVMNADATNRTRLTELTAGSYSCNNPVWSPDGKHIAYVSGGNSDNAYVMNVDGTNQIQLSNYEDYPAANYAFINDLIWSPDGKRIAYSAGAKGFYMKDADGTNQTKLGSGDWFSWTP